jgi:DNA-binding transcriptional ArsR family regulator
VRILQRLFDAGEASPSELADALEEPLGNVSYHVRVLRELDCLELSRTEPRRGALEHFYRATVSPWLSDEQWARLPPAFRHRTTAQTLAKTVQAAVEAGGRGAFDEPEGHVSRIALEVDEAGRDEIAALLEETHEAALRIHAASVRRRAEQGPGAPPPISTELALILLRQADSGLAAPPASGG